MKSASLFLAVAIAAAASEISSIAHSPRAGDFYVAPGGQPSNPGSKTAPWDLATALYRPKTVYPGATIWIRGGHYGDGKTIFQTRLLDQSRNVVKSR